MEAFKFEDAATISVANNAGRPLTRFLCCEAELWCKVIAWIQMFLLVIIVVGIKAVFGILSVVGCVVIMVSLESAVKMYENAIKNTESKDIELSDIKRLQLMRQESAVQDQFANLIFPTTYLCVLTLVSGLVLLFGNAKKKHSYLGMWIVFQVAGILFSVCWLATGHVSVTVAADVIFILVNVVFLYAVFVRAVEIRQEEKSREAAYAV